MQPRLCACGFQPKNPNTTNRAELQNTKSNILTCFKTRQQHKTKLYKCIKEYNNKKTKTNKKIKVQIRKK